MIVMIYECFKEHDNGMWQIVQTSSKSGRMIPCVEKIYIYYWIYAFCAYIHHILYQQLLLSVLLYGVSGIWKAPVQSIETMSRFTIKCNTWRHICRTLFNCIVLYLVMFGSIILALFTVIKETEMLYFIGSVIFAGSRASAL